MFFKKTGDWKIHDIKIVDGAIGEKWVIENPKATTFTPKKIVYRFKGTPYGIGKLTGHFGGPALVDNLVNGAWKAIKNDLPTQLQSGPLGNSLKDFLVALIYIGWCQEVQKNHIPSWFCEEIEGILAGTPALKKQGKKPKKLQYWDVVFPNYIATYLMRIALVPGTLKDQINFLEKLVEEAVKWVEANGHELDFDDDTRAAFVTEIHDVLKNPNFKLDEFPMEMLQSIWKSVVPLCDGYAVKDGALASGKGVLVARSLQAGGESWAKNVCHVIRIPCDKEPLIDTAKKIKPHKGTYRGKISELLPTLTIGVLGQVGSLTCMNSKGFASGTQTLRSSAISTDFIGIGSALLCRYTVEVGSDTDEGIAAARRAVRGVPYNHIMGDHSGNIVVSEIIASGGWPQKKPISYLSGAYNGQHKKHCEKFSGLLAHALENTNFEKKFPPKGVYPRSPVFDETNDPNGEKIADINVKLFKAIADVDISADRFTNPSEFVWDHWAEEQTAQQKKAPKNMGSYWFPPARNWSNPNQNKNKVISTNYPVNREIALSAMTESVMQSGKGAEAGQWRFDLLNKQVYDDYGTITVETWKGDAELGTGMQYISPYKKNGVGPDYPLYKKQSPVPPDPGEYYIVGSMAIMDLSDLGNLTMHAKYGYWNNDWTELVFNEWIEHDLM